MAIRSQGKEIKLHRVIVCAQSEIIAAEVEAQSDRVIEIGAFAFETVFHMFKVLYTQQYGLLSTEGATFEQLKSNERLPRPPVEAEMSNQPNVSNTNIPVKNQLLAHVQVHAIASHYEVPQLKVCATQRIGKALEVDTFSVQDIIELLPSIYQLQKSEDVGMHALIVNKVGFTGADELLETGLLATAMAKHQCLNEFALELMARNMVECKLCMNAAILAD